MYYISILPHVECLLHATPNQFFDFSLDNFLVELYNVVGHAVVDALGNPVHFLLSGGNIFDASAAIDLLSEVNIFGSNILGDKAYGTKSIRTYITEQRASYTIPPKSNVIEPWFCDFHTYKERHLIECFFNKLKVFRRVATRYDKFAVSFLAFVHLASIWILLK